MSPGAAGPEPAAAGGGAGRAPGDGRCAVPAAAGCGATAVKARRRSADCCGAGPPLGDELAAAACEATGLEVAVCVWWRGVPGRAAPASRRAEDAWLRAAAAGGVRGGAVHRLLGAGIPEQVVEGGLQLGHWLLQDFAVGQLWARCRRSRGSTVSDFTSQAVQLLFQRFDVRPAGPGSESVLELAPLPAPPPAAPAAPPPGAAAAARPRSAGRWLGPRGSEARSPQPEPEGTASTPARLARRSSTSEASEPMPTPRVRIHTDGDSRRDSGRRSSGGSSAPPGERRRPSTARATLRLQAKKKKSSFAEFLDRRAQQQRLEDLQRLQEVVAEPEQAPIVIVKNTTKAQKMVVRDLEEVRRIFNTFDADQSGAIEPAEFLPLLSRLMRQPQSEMDKAVVWQCWEGMDEDGSGQITFDEFEKWYCDTFGCSPTDHTEAFTADHVPAEQREIRTIAKKLGLDNVQTEELWKKFKALDEDDSGSLEFEEFKVLMNQKINPGKSKDDYTQVSDRMMKQFWADIDADKSGAVTFSEFAEWYVKMFMNGVGSDPLESYYDLVGRNHREILVDRMNGRKRSTRSGAKAFWRDEAEDGAGKLEA